METTSHLNQVINCLPDDLANDQAAFEKNWAKVINDKSHRLTPKAPQKASQIAETCVEDYRVGKTVTMCACLEQHHDYLASKTKKSNLAGHEIGGIKKDS